MIEYEAQKLKIREELAKAGARVSAYDEVKPVDFGKDCSEKAIIRKKKQLDHDGRYHKVEYGNTAPRKVKNCINHWDSSAVRNDYKDESSQKPITKNSVPAVTVDGGVSLIMCQLLKQQSAPDILI